MTTPELIRTQILDLVKEYHTAKFAPKTFDPDRDLVRYDFTIKNSTLSPVLKGGLRIKVGLRIDGLRIDGLRIDGLRIKIIHNPYPLIPNP